jgi:hypothetical protein
MAYTEAQWNKFQALLPPEERVPYLNYLQEADPGAYNKAIGATLSRLKADAQETAKTTVVDEQAKLAGAKTDTAAQKAAVAKTAADAKAKGEAAQAAVMALTSGKALTDAQKALLNIKTTTATPTTTFTKAELQKIVATLGAGGQLTPEQAAAINATVSGTGVVTGTTTTTPTTTTPTTTTPTTTTPTTTTPTTTTPTTTTPTTTTPTTTTPTTTTPTGGPGKQPGAAWILSPDGKSWVKPTMPKEKNKAFSWDDEKGWIGFTVGSASGEDVEGGDPNADATPVAPIGTPPAFVYDPITKTWKMPVKPTEEGNWVWDNIKGWTKTGVTPGSTGFEAGNERTLAQDTFKNTLALFFGANEMSQPWVNALFKVVSGFYKTGSTIDESLNLALQEARNNPILEPFTKRFAGVYALQDRLAAGEAISVPTIAEFFKSEATLGDRLREVGLGDLATQELLGEVLGTGKSVSAVLNLVNDVFMTIDNAPDALKKDLQVVAPGIDRTSIAKALLLGKRGADELQKKIREVSVFSAAKSQGIGIENALAADIAARGVDYGTALTNFGTVAKGAVPLQKLTEISTGQAVKPGEAQGSLIKSIFQQDVRAQEQIRLEAEKEVARFSGSSGTMGSRSLASRNRANRVI